MEIPEDFNAPPPPEDQQGDPAQFAPPFSSAKIIAHPSSVYPDLIEKILPAGSINILSGGSGVGKTAFVADWCARFRDGRSICWKPTRIPTGGIGVITADRKWSSHRQWFDAVGFSDIPHVSLRDDPTFNWESLNNKSVLPQIMETCIRRLGLGRDALIVVDPISMFVHGNLLDYKQTAIALARLDKVCTFLGVTVIGIAHTAKQKGEAKDRYVRPQDRILGSSAWAGFTDTVMYLIGPEELDVEYHGFGWVPHHHEPATFTFARHPDTGLFVPWDAPNKNADLAHIYSLVTESEHGTATKEIVDASVNHIGVARTTIYGYLQLLATQGKIEKIGRGTWRRVGVPLVPPT